MIKKILKLFLLDLLTIIFFTSCFEQIVSISENNRGIITYKITYYKEFDTLLKLLSDKHGIDLNTSIVFDKKKVEDILSKNKDIKILDYNIKNSGITNYSELSLIYNNISNMPPELPFNFFTIKSYEENRTVYYNTTIALNRLYNNKDIRALYRSLKDEDKKIADSYLKIIKLKFIFKSEKLILSTNIGNTSQDKKEIQYSTTMYDQFNNKMDTEIIITYKK